MYSLQPSLVFINLTNSIGATFIYENVIFHIFGNNFIGNIGIDKIDRQKWSIVLTFSYNCRSLNSPVELFCKFFKSH